jgi:hypothetical protein
MKKIVELAAKRRGFKTSEPLIYNPGVILVS